MLETERLFLTEYQTGDIDNFYKLKGYNEVWKYSSFTQLREKEQAITLLDNLINDRSNGNYVFMALYKKDTREFIGEAGIIGYNLRANRCEIGYNLLPQYWNKGYATEITKGLVKYAFECLGVERVEALVLQVNRASCKVLEKSGFQLEGVLRNFNRCEIGYRNVCYYGVIYSDLYKESGL